MHCTRAFSCWSEAVEVGLGVAVMVRLPALSESQRQHTQHVVTAMSSVVTEKNIVYPWE